MDDCQMDWVSAKYNKYRSFPCCATDFEAVIVVMKADAKIHLYGSFKLQCLFGSATINGYVTEAGSFDVNRWLEVVAPVKLGPPIILKSFAAKDTKEKDPNIRLQLHRLKWRLKELSTEEDIKQMQHFFDGPGSSVCVIAGHRPVCIGPLKQLYGMHFFQPTQNDQQQLNFRHLTKTCSISIGAPIPQLYENDIKLALNSLVTAIDIRNDITVIAILGAKDTGKSTLARLLCNILASNRSQTVFYMDTDLGQSERTPPGCVSLYPLQQPFLCSPLAQQQWKCFEMSYFCGDVTADSVESVYIESISLLIKAFRNDSIRASGTTATLVVNTHGYLNGDGVPLMYEILDILQPDYVIRLKHPDSVQPITDELDDKLVEQRCHMVFRCQPPVKYAISGSVPTAASKRDMLVTGYFCTMLLDEKDTAEDVSPRLSQGIEALLLSVAPISVKWSRVGLKFPPDYRIPQEQIMNVLNLSLVALCAVDSDQLSKCDRYLDDSSLPYVVKTEQPLKCIGFGIIRAIDMDKKLFYVLTPVEMTKLQSVNVLAKGSNIDIPRSFILSQAASIASPYIVRPQNLNSLETFSSSLHKPLKVHTGHLKGRKMAAARKRKLQHI